MLIVTVFIFVKIKFTVLIFDKFTFVQLIFSFISLLFIIFVFHYSLFLLPFLTTISPISFPSFVIQLLPSPISIVYPLIFFYPSCFFFPIRGCIYLIPSSATFESEYADLIFSQFLTRFSIPLMYIAHNNLFQFYSFFCILYIHLKYFLS